MFKSSENLRLAADMRALERVARPWREVRRTWFDGTPESIEARLAATERVLTHARGGLTTAHVALEREASIARAELKEAAHRLMVDPLDDSARAFRGSRRVAGDGMSYEDTMSHIDQVLAEGQGHDLHAYPGLSKYDIDFDEGYASDDDPDWSCSSCGEPGALPVVTYDDGPEHDPDDPDRALCPDCFDEWKDGGTPSDTGELRNLRRERHEEHPDMYPAHHGSRRTAGGHDEDDDDVCSDPHEEGCRASLDDGEGFDGYCGNCADRLEAQGHWGHHDASRRKAAPMTSPSDGGSATPLVEMGGGGASSIPGAIGQLVANGATMTGQEPSMPFNPGPASTRAARRTAGDDHDPYHGKQWPHDFPLPEGTSPKWNDDDTLTCPNCGYDEVELNRQGECPECDHYHADFIDDSDGDHNSFESQMERKYPILPEHGGPESGLWGGKWAPRPFESARLAAGQPGHTPSHGFPIAEGDEVHYVGPGSKGHPDKVKGTVLEYPAMGPNFENDDDPDADEDVPRHDAALVYWGEPDEGDASIEFVDDIVPNQHLNEYSRRLRRQSGLRTASNGGLDWKYDGGGSDDGTRGHDATTEVGDLLQTHPEYPVGRHPTRPNVKVVHTDQPPVGWGYGIWTNESPEDDDYVHQGGNGRTIYKTHDEAKAAAEEHYYSLGHNQRQRGHGGGFDSGVDYDDLNKFMDGGDGGAPGEDFDYFGKESMVRAASVFDWRETTKPGQEPPFGNRYWRADLENGHSLYMRLNGEGDGEGGTTFWTSIYHPGHHSGTESLPWETILDGRAPGDLHRAQDDLEAHYMRMFPPGSGHAPRDSNVDYGDLNKFMDGGGQGGAPGDDFDYFGKESRMMARLAASGMSYEDAMAHIDEVLNAGEGHDLHHQPGVKGFNHSDIFDHCRACGGDGRSGQAGTPLGDDVCEGCGGTGENQGDPYGECEGCGADTQVEDLTGDPDTGMYCPDCGGDACDYCGLNGGGHRHGCPER